jgi:epoxyqueuosine reductase
MQLEDRVRAEAAALGFTRCGFAAAVPIARGAFLDGWLGAGFAGGMHYLGRHPERRLTVAGILPRARTVISLAFPYTAPPPPPLDWRRTLRGRVAAYARGADYHHVIEERLGALETALAGLVPGAATRRYVDTGAVLEREWGMRGGLGWFGKNTMLLATRGGSWFFLAELVTEAVLAPDTPTDEHCGRCTRCLEACPTAALGDGLVMDARRCIAYLTIEHRGPIPRHLRAALGPWIFGCDVCQEVCPWNAASAPSPAPDGGGLFPFLPDLLRLDPSAFRRRFSDTSLARTRRRGLLRNAAVVLGNTGNAAAVPALRHALVDRDPLVREHAAWALGAIGGAEAAEALAERASREPHLAVRAEIDEARRSRAHGARRPPAPTRTDPKSIRRGGGR